jgi:hypothetical protein
MTFAIDPGTNPINLSNDTPAYPILPSKSIILGGRMLNFGVNEPYYVPSPDLQSGRIIKDLNSNLHSASTQYFYINANPSWTDETIQQSTIICNTKDNSYYLKNQAVDAYIDIGYFIVFQSSDCGLEYKKLWTIKVYNLEYKLVIKFEKITSQKPFIFPISKHFLYWLDYDDPVNKILDLSGKVVVEAGRITVLNDPSDRFLLVDYKLYDLLRKDYAPIDIDGFEGMKAYRFLPECIEIINMCSVSPPIKSNRPHIWRYDYEYNLMLDIDVEYPLYTMNANCHFMYNDLMVFYDHTQEKKVCGWHFYDYKTRQTKLYISDYPERELGQCKTSGNMMLIPNKDGALKINLDTLALDKLYFPSNASITKTEQGYFAVAWKDENDQPYGYLLDENLKPIEQSKTYVAKAQNYIYYNKKIYSINNSYVWNGKLHELSVTIHTSIIGEKIPKHAGYYKIKSVYIMPLKLEDYLFNGNLYIPTSVADFFSIDLATMKSRSFINDELTYKYPEIRNNVPVMYVNDMMTAWFHDSKRLIMFDKWKNLKVDFDLSQIYTHRNFRCWFWWGKAIISTNDATYIISLGGDIEKIMGYATSFNNGYLMLIQTDVKTGERALLGYDVDTCYKKTIWSSVRNPNITTQFKPLGKDYIINNSAYNSVGDLIQTGLSKVVCDKVCDGSTIMGNSEGTYTKAQSDYFLAKWSPAPHYSIKRTYKNEFEITMTRGDEKSSPLVGKFYICKWGYDGRIPEMTKLYELASVASLGYNQRQRFRIKMPVKSSLVQDIGDKSCFGLVFIGNGLLDLTNSNLEKKDDLGRALFDGTPVDAQNQQAISVTVWAEQ